MKSPQEGLYTAQVSPLPGCSGPSFTHHDGEDQSHDVDGVRGAKTRDDGEPQVVLGHGHVLLGLVILSVGLGTAVQSPLEVRAGSVLRHGRGARCREAEERTVGAVWGSGRRLLASC